MKENQPILFHVWAIIILALSIEGYTNKDVTKKSELRGYNEICKFCPCQNPNDCYSECEDYDCNTEEHLRCYFSQHITNSSYTQRCRCSENDYVYNENMNQCQGTVGANCSTNIEDDCIISTYCEPDSVSSPFGKCVCKNGLVRGIDEWTRKCHPDYGQPCTGKLICDKDRSLHCNQNANSSYTCQCNRNAMYYDTSLEKCVSKVDEQCGHGGYDCYSKYGMQCGGNAYCDPSTFRCACKDGYLSNADRTVCTKLVGGSCEQDSECPLNSICENRVCKCLADFVEQDKQCFLPLGSFCGSNRHACGKYAICDFINGFYQCNCNPGHNADNGVCYLSQHHDSSGCENDPFMCHEKLHFECVMKLDRPQEVYYRCECKKGYSYYNNYPENTCLGLYSTPCGLNATTVCDDSFECDQSTNVCSCKTGYNYDVVYKYCKYSNSFRVQPPRYAIFIILFSMSFIISHTL